MLKDIIKTGEGGFFDHVPRTGLICAHRGARSIAPENTMLALKTARNCGAHCWETDVRQARGGELIIFHDDTLERCTDICARPGAAALKPWKVESCNLEELRRLDAGGWFLENDPYGTVAEGVAVAGSDGQQIPLLCEVLEFTAKHRFPVNLEIKDLHGPEGDDGVVDAVLTMIQETCTMDLVLLSSFRHEYLHRARNLSQDIAIAVLAVGQHPPDLINYLKSFAAAAYHPDQELCDDVLMTALGGAGFRVNSWTVNDMTRAQQMLSAGIGVITDWPQRLV